MVTQAQIDAGRIAHDKYMAAQQAGNTQQAQQVYQQASQDLGISGERANTIYNNPSKARSNTQIKQDSGINANNSSSPWTQNSSGTQTNTTPINTTPGTSGTSNNIDYSKMNDVKIGDIVPRFGYETTMSERQDRNAKIAQGLFDTGRDFNEQNTFDEIKTLAPDVTNPEIQHTVNDIRDRFGRLKFVAGIGNMDAASVVGAINQGTIGLNDLSGLQISDPAKYAEITGLIEQQRNLEVNNNILNTMNSIYGDGTINDDFTALDEMNKKYSEALAATDGEDALATYKEALNDQTLIDNQSALAENKTQLNDINEQLNGLKRDVEDEFGSNATKSLINSVVADRGANLIRQKNSLMIQNSGLVENVNNAISRAEQNYKLDLQQEQIQRENIITQYGMDKDIFEKRYAAMQSKLNKQEKLELAKLGMLEQLDLANISDSDIEGLDTADFVKDMLKFKKTIEGNAGENTKYNMQVVDGKMVFYDNYGNVKDTYTPGGGDKNIRWSSGDEMRTDRNNNPTALMYTSGVAKWFKSHGYDVSKGDKFPNSDNYTLDMNNLSDPVKATIDYIDAYTFEHNGTPRRTHTNISKDERDKKSYEEKRDVVKQMYAKEGGDGHIFGESVTSTSGGFDNTMEGFYKKYLNTKGSQLTSADLKQIKDSGLTSKEFFSQAYNYKKAQDMKLKPQAQQLLTNLTNVKAELAKLDLVGYSGFLANAPFTEGRQIRKDLSQAIASQALQNLISLKADGATFGALSDAELSFITDMATNIDVWAQRGDLNNAIQKSIDILNKGVNSVGGTTTPKNNPFDNDGFVE